MKDYSYTRDSIVHAAISCRHSSNEKDNYCRKALRYKNSPDFNEQSE